MNQIFYTNKILKHNKIISIIMANQQKAEALEGMLNKVKPKARYMSQMHVEDNIDSLMKQIVNGDIEIPEERQSIDKMGKKKGFQYELRAKLLNKVQQQKLSLQQKLSYINNSINSIKNYQHSKQKGVSRYESVSQLMEATKQKDKQLKRQIAENKKSVEQKKKKVQQIHKKKIEQQRERMEKLKLEQKSRKQKDTFQHMQKLKESMEMREKQFKSGDQRLKQVLKQRKYHEKLSQSFNEKINNELEERKKKLAEIRSLHKPIDINQIQQHEQRFIEIKKQKQELREREKRMNQSRSKTYRAPYQSMFYKRLVQQNQQDQHLSDKIKVDKMKQFAEHVKNNFSPSIDQKKRHKIEQEISKQQQRRKYWQEKHKQLLEKPKLKGLEYLESLRKLPKKRSGTSSPSNLQRANLTERPQYPNYLNRSVNMSQHKPWKTILKGNGDKQQKALLLHFQSQKVEEELKRKEQRTRLAKMRDTGDIDQQYYQMIKAKLDLLQEPQDSQH